MNKKQNLSLKNIEQAKNVLQKLYSLGVRDFVMCPGGRNAPFVELLENLKSEDIEIHLGFEERSAAFFGLGLSMKDHQPVAIFTTSGTAFVETSPALLEAHYLGVPLIVISSDRPEYQSGTGAPQTMIQKDFLKSHLGQSVDADFELQDITLPLHINCIFDEPLLDQDIKPWKFDTNNGLKKNSGMFQKFQFNQTKLNPYKYKFTEYTKEILDNILEVKKNSTTSKALFIFSGLDLEFKKMIRSKLQNLNADLYFEATGEVFGLQNEINSKQISDVDVLKNYDLVVRVGGIPTHRIWRDFENQKFCKILHFSNLPLPGMSFGEVCPLEQFESFLKDFKTVSSIKYIKSVSSLGLSKEQSIFSSLKKLASDTVFYIGNSMPIRNWDLIKKNHFEHVYANRGLNGIDGQLSTALGLAFKFKSSEQMVFAVLGDLTTLYDLAAAWYWMKHKSKIKFCLIVINNSGGQIFSKMFNSKYFLNQHNINFKSYAEMWGLSYLKLTSVQEFEDIQKLNIEYPDLIEFKVES